MTVTDAMKRDWEERARKNAFHYIASWRKDWDPSSFFDSGEEDYHRLVTPVLAAMNFSPRDKSMVEVGCGAGRMTRVFAREFAHVDALDISPEMQRQAKEYLREFQNIRWVLADGATLCWRHRRERRFHLQLPGPPASPVAGSRDGVAPRNSTHAQARRSFSSAVQWRAQTFDELERTCCLGSRKPFVERRVSSSRTCHRLRNASRPGDGRKELARNLSRLC